MLGNGIQNIIAAALIAGAILWNGGFGANRSGGAMSDEEFAAWYARAVGDIRNDIVINCGCCGDEGPRRAVTESF